MTKKVKKIYHIISDKFDEQTKDRDLAIRIFNGYRGFGSAKIYEKILDNNNKLVSEVCLLSYGGFKN